MQQVELVPRRVWPKPYLQLEAGRPSVSPYRALPCGSKRYFRNTAVSNSDPRPRACALMFYLAADMHKASKGYGACRLEGAECSRKKQSREGEAEGACWIGDYKEVASLMAKRKS